MRPHCLPTMGFRVMLAFTLVIAAAARQTDKGYELRVKDSEGPVKRICFETKVAAKGSYYIAGPAKFDGNPKGNWKYRAMMDGLGMVNRFELRPEDQPNKMCYTSSWMNTGLYNDYIKDPTKPPRGVLFEDTAPPRSNCLLHMCDYKAPNDNNWINMIVVGNEAIWVNDVPGMVAMNLKTLNFTGFKAWADTKTSMGIPMPNWFRSDHLIGGGSAHPLMRPGTTTVVELVTETPLVFGSYFLDLFTFDAALHGPQARTKFASLEMTNNQYFHSYGVTPNYVVLPFNLQTVSLGPGHPPFLMGSFKGSWKGLHVVDLKGNVQVFDDLEPFYHVHIANTFENASGITMDLGVYDSIPFARMPLMDIQQTLNKTLRDGQSDGGQLRRIHMNFETKKTSVEKLTNNQKDYDFLKINPAFHGLPHCIYYAVEWFHDDVSYASMAVMKHNICKGQKTFWSQDDVYINEPFFIQASHGDGEDDGTVIFTANDGQKGKAIFVALDAKTFTEIERTELPNHIPFTAHGQFVPETAPESVLV